MAKNEDRIHDKDNSFAMRNGSRIYIMDAESGRKGYSCTSCSNEMQAVRNKKPDRVSYFRHDAKDVQWRKTCTYSDEAERKKIAIEFLVQLKSIKVPAVQKLPLGHDGAPMEIAKPKVIKANKVLTEQYFYENTFGRLFVGLKNENPELTFLAKGDVVLFDQTDTPILIINLVSAHKLLKDEVLIGLKRLDIDAVQVRIPKESPEAIGQIFQKTGNTKWIYNHEHERAQYVSVPALTSEPVQPLDDLQREFFGETILCRQAEIRNLIRSITRCLESKHYREIVQDIGREEERINKEAIRIDGDRAKLQKRLNDEIESELGPRIENNRSRRNKLSAEKERINGLRIKLEQRYKRKRDHLEVEEAKYGSRIDQEHREKGDRGSTIITRKEKIESEISSIERNIGEEETNIAGIQRETETLPEKFGKEEEGLLGEVTDCEKEFERLRDETESSARQRASQGSAQLSESFEGATEYGRLLRDTIETNSAYNRIRAAYKSIGSETGKNWND